MNKHKILYVEDELIILLEIRKELENEGYEVTTREQKTIEEHDRLLNQDLENKKRLQEIIKKTFRTLFERGKENAFN